MKARSAEFLGLKKVSDAIRHVTIRGRVQGVGYRAWVEHQARPRTISKAGCATAATAASRRFSRTEDVVDR